MTIGTLAALVLALVGLVSAIVFGVHARRRLAQVRKTPPLPAPKNAMAADPADDVPTMRFEGEAFEHDWQGSKGYARPDGLWARTSGSWTDFLIVPVVTPLRPSRFSDPSYWTRYLPGVLALRVLLFMLLPLLIILLDQPTNGAAGTFSPSPTQRAVPAHNTAYVTDPAGCSPAVHDTSTADRPVFVNYVDDGTVFWVRPGRLVVISYLYGKPVFSPDVPLCVPTTAASADKSGVVEYQATGSGTGYIYIPQPNGTVVAEIRVSNHNWDLVYIVIGLTAAVICYDIMIVVRLRRATRARVTRV